MKLDTKSRRALPDSAFALPGRRFPIHDLRHARAALMMKGHATKAEQAEVVRKVYARYPELRPEQEKRAGLPRAVANGGGGLYGRLLRYAKEEGKSIGHDLVLSRRYESAGWSTLAANRRNSLGPSLDRARDLKAKAAKLLEKRAEESAVRDAVRLMPFAGAVGGMLLRRGKGASMLEGAAEGAGFGYLPSAAMDAHDILLRRRAEKAAAVPKQPKLVKTAGLPKALRRLTHAGGMAVDHTGVPHIDQVLEAHRLGRGAERSFGYADKLDRSVAIPTQRLQDIRSGRLTVLGMAPEDVSWAEKRTQALIERKAAEADVVRKAGMHARLAGELAKRRGTR